MEKIFDLKIKKERHDVFFLQTITSAMSTLTPPVTLGDTSNQSKMDYVLEVSSSPDFDYPPVSQPRPICVVMCCVAFPR